MSKKPTKESKGHSTFYVAVDEDPEAEDMKRSANCSSDRLPAKKPAAAPHHQPPAVSQQEPCTSGYKPPLRPKPVLVDKNKSTCSLSSEWSQMSGSSSKEEKEELEAEDTEVVLRRRRHTFPIQAASANAAVEETEDHSEENDDGEEDEAEFEGYGSDSEDEILTRRRIVMNSLRVYFKRLLEDMFPKPSEAREEKTKNDPPKGEKKKKVKFFARGSKAKEKKSKSLPVTGQFVSSASQSEMLSHLAQEMGENCKPEDIVSVLGSIRFSDLLSMEQTELQKQQTANIGTEVLRASAISVSVDAENAAENVSLPQAETVVDDAGKMTRCLPVPAQPHKLMLLKELFSSYGSCKIVIDETAGMVIFEGSEEAVEEANNMFDTQMNNLAEDRRDFSKTLISIFRSPMGQNYLNDVTSAHNGCKLHVGTSFLLCVGFARNDVRGCLTEIQSDVRTEPLKVSNLNNQDLNRLRQQIEGEYLARMLYQDATDGEVLLEGLGRDVDLAKGFLLTQAEEYQKDTDIFLIKGEARAKCFRHCFPEQLNEVKNIIRQNKGSLDERFEKDRFMLTYQIRQGLLNDVQVRLRMIRGSIWEDATDLKAEFPDTVDQWLLLEGFRKKNVKEFQASFERTVCETCFVEISITSKRWGNLVRNDYSTKKRDPEPPRKKLNPIMNWYYTGRFKSQPFHKSVIIRNTLVTVMSGDISAVTADVMVSPVGKDLNMSGTAVGKAFLKRFGNHVQEGLSCMVNNHGDVIEIPLPPDQLPVYALYHVLLQKWPHAAVAENIKTLIKTCLALAEENRCTSIAFPLLGCGKKFKLPFETVMNAMIDATRGALVKASSGSSLQKLTFVLYSTREAQSFAQQLEYLAPAVLEHRDTSAELQESGDWLLEKLASVIPKAEQTEGMLLTAHLYGPARAVLQTARARLVQELRQIFLYEDTVEHGGLLQLSKMATNEIRTAAQVDSVIITRPATGGSCLRLKGEHQAVLKLKELVQGKLLQLPVYSARQATHDISNLRSLPVYWSIVANPTLLVEAVEMRYKLVSVSEEERVAIENLVVGTWRPNLVTAGWDATGLHHKSIDVIRVQRVENPSLFENYYNRRRALQRESSDNNPCRPVGSLPFSSGHVETTAFLTAGNPLFRDLHVDVNEHYMFHGTRKQNLQAILRYGPDARLANSGGMLGPGIYFAESFTKSDRYADDRTRRTGGEKTVLLMRVLLGKPFVSTDVRPTRYLRPPCMGCKEDRCRDNHGGFFDSVIDDCLTLRAFREFIVYESALCYPEYVITYMRQGY